jgi:hypothetical protein
MNAHAEVVSTRSTLENPTVVCATGSCASKRRVLVATHTPLPGLRTPKLDIAGNISFGPSVRQVTASALTDLRKTVEYRHRPNPRNPPEHPSHQARHASQSPFSVTNV